MKKYNKYLLPEKTNQLNLYDIKIVNTYNGDTVDPKSLVAKVIGENETFHIFILPNYQEKWVRF